MLLTLSLPFFCDSYSRPQFTQLTFCFVASARIYQTLRCTYILYKHMYTEIHMYLLYTRAESLRSVLFLCFRQLRQLLTGSCSRCHLPLFLFLLHFRLVHCSFSHFRPLAAFCRHFAFNWKFKNFGTACLKLIIITRCTRRIRVVLCSDFNEN